MKKTLTFITLTGIFLLCFFFVNKERKIERVREKEDYALEWFNNWYDQRAMPFEKIPNGAYLRAAQYVKAKMLNEKSFKTTDTSQWHSIGPDNIGGRVLAIAVDPSNSSNVWVGAASGGLWKSTTAGIGASAWSYVNTGYPTLAVSSVVINPSNPSIIYIGTGEVGSAYGRGTVGTPGARATYGMGVLKSTNGGTAWFQTGLTSTFPQITAVQKVILNPQNPNTIYAATTEGVYKSANGGANWTLTNSELMAMDIVINPSDTTVLYSAHGQRNSTASPGIYKTTNAGSTWTLLGGGLPTSNFGRTSLAISPTKPQVVYAGISDASSLAIIGLYKTTDAGTTWSLKSTTNYVSAQGWYDNVIAVHPVNAETVYCAGLDIYKSVNGGSTLAHQTNWAAGYDHIVPAGGPEGPSYYAHADHHAITFDPNNPNIMYHGCDGGIFVSTDGGSTFAGRNGGFITTQFYNGLANAESGEIYALGGLQDNGTVKYTGAMSWDKTYGGDGGWCAIDPTNANTLYEEYVYLVISKSINGGANWFSATSGLATGSSNANFIAPFVISPSNPNILYAGAKTVYKTTNGGTNWFVTNGGVNFNGTPVACIGVSDRSSDTLLAGTGATGGTFQIFRSVNGGTSWSNVTGSLPNRYPTDISFDPSSSLNAYIAYSGYGASHAFKSTDAGLTWTDITSNLPDIPAQSIVVDPLYPSHLYLGTDLGVYRSLDGGASWQVFDFGMPPAMVLDLSLSMPYRILRAATFGNGVYERELPTLNVFDYRALALLSPATASTISMDSVVGPISASFRNFGAQTQPDSFNVKYRIFKGASELYSSTKRIAPLGLGEIRQVTFDGTFTPPDTGTYTLEAISLAADANSANDTARGMMFVIKRSHITYSIVQKTSCTYTEITGGSSGPSGDDVQMSIGLPFPFEFDGYSYDLLQISTNGWVEFGTGASGTLRGLSTSAQIGSYFSQQIATTGRPNKAVGIWWSDLNTSPGNITYKTLGSAPNRSFVVQWKGVTQYGASTTLNFQIELFETSDNFTLHYGPIVFGSSVADGAVGMKDEIGGDLRYYDFVKGGTGMASEALTNLDPNVDWPGNNACYQVAPPPVSSLVTVSVNSRWNLVSVPVTRTDHTVASIFPTALPSTTYLYNHGYMSSDTMIAGVGYWTKFPGSAAQPISGTALPIDSIPVVAGWNLVGSVDHAIAAPSGGIVASNFYGFSVGYNIVDSLRPGKGYWVRSFSDGTLTLGSLSVPKISAHLDEFASVVISDAEGNGQTLYLAGNTDDGINLGQYEMPPSSPAGILDVRFASQRILETYQVTGKGSSAYPIAVKNAQYPLQVSFSPKNGKGKQFILDELVAGKVVASHLLSERQRISIPRRVETNLVLRVSGNAMIPTSYALKQNYPNPFNPATTISFDIPENSFVSLKVYDLNGREVKHLIEGNYAAGSYSIGVDLSNVASGVYFYRLTAGTFSGLKKMVLIK